MRSVVKLEIPKDTRGISANASIHSTAAGGYRTVIAVTKHPEEAPIRTDIVREFSSRYLLMAYLKTRTVLKKSVKNTALPSALEKEDER